MCTRGLASAGGIYALEITVQKRDPPPNGPDRCVVVQKGPLMSNKQGNQDHTDVQDEFYVIGSQAKTEPAWEARVKTAEYSVFIMEQCNASGEAIKR